MYSRTMSVFVAIAICLFTAASQASDLVLADGCKSDYQIVLADNASPSTRHGAEELQTFLAQMTGVKLPIVSDQKPMGPHEIILGDNAHLCQLGVAVDFKSLGLEGYVIQHRWRASGDRRRPSCAATCTAFTASWKIISAAAGSRRASAAFRKPRGSPSARSTTGKCRRWNTASPYVRRLFRRRLVRAEPDELEHRAVGSEARRQGEVPVACPYV